MKLITSNYRPIGAIKEAVSIYTKDDCCYGCPYRCCPNRPENAMEEKRPIDCVWSCYQRLCRKEVV